MTSANTNDKYFLVWLENFAFVFSLNEKNHHYEPYLAFSTSVALFFCICIQILPCPARAQFLVIKA